MSALAKFENLTIETLSPLQMDKGLVERWSQLQADQPGLDSPFLGPEWSRATARAQKDMPGSNLVAVALRNGNPVGFFPTRAHMFTAQPVGAPMCDYQALVAEQDLSLDPRSLVRSLGVGRFDFSHMLADQRTFAAHGRGQCESWIVDTPQGYEAYEAQARSQGKKTLSGLDKKRRKAERELGPLTFRAFSRSRTDLDQLLAWKRAQFQATGQTDVLARLWTQRLIDELFASRDPMFGATLFTLHARERLVAAHLHLRGRHVLHAWLIAHDAEFERYSPGMLLFQDILRWMDHSPFSSIDLGAGDYRFKRELANRTRAILYGFVGVPSPASLVRGAEYGLRRLAERLPLGPISQLPGKAMRRLDIYRALG